MKINSLIRYTIQQFINDFTDRYSIFSYRTVEKFAYKDGNYDTIIEDYSLPFKFSFGATKLCLIFPDCKEYVYKIPLYYRFDCYDERDLARCASYEAKCGRYERFLSTDNLCEVEVNLYKDAQNIGIGYCFAKEFQFMEYHGIPVYAQERIEQTYFDRQESDYYEVKEADYEIREEIFCKQNEIDNKFVNEFITNKFFIEDMYKYSGEDFGLLLEFIAANDINDLHNENVGYDFMGNPKIMDYSGFMPTDD